MDYVDLTMLEYNSYVVPSPAPHGVPDEAAPKKEVSNASFDPFPLLAPPSPQQRTKKPSDNVVKEEPSFPPQPRAVFSYFEATEISLGPTRLVLLPPREGVEKTIHKVKRNQQWTANLWGQQRSVLCLNRRPVFRPSVEDVLSTLRGHAAGKHGQALAVAVPSPPPRVVPSSMSTAALSLHAMMHALVNACFTPSQVASDFLLFSLLKREITLGMYSTPPQLVLNVHRRVSIFTDPRERQDGLAVVRRLDSLWRRWRVCWYVRDAGQCHHHIEGTLDKYEEHFLKGKQEAEGDMKMLKDRFVCGAGEIEEADSDWQSTEGDGKMSLSAAVTLAMRSPEAYPAFVVKAGLDGLAMDGRYAVTFKALSAPLDVTPSTDKVVFVRNWAVPFLDLPERFDMPNPLPTLPAPQKKPTPSATSSEPPHPSAPKPTKKQEWDSPVVKTVGLRRYRASLLVDGQRLKIGDDVLVNEGARPTQAKAYLQKKKFGRIVGLLDEGDGTKKTALLRHFLHKATPQVAGYLKALPKGKKRSSLLDPLDHEVFATTTLSTVAPDKLVPIQIRTTSGPGVTLPPLDDVAGIYPAELAGTTDRLLEVDDTDPSWPSFTVKNKAPVFNLVCGSSFSEGDGFIPLPGTKRAEEEDKPAASAFERAPSACSGSSVGGVSGATGGTAGRVKISFGSITPPVKINLRGRTPPPVVKPERHSLPAPGAPAFDFAATLAANAASTNPNPQLQLQLQPQPQPQQQTTSRRLNLVRPAAPATTPAAKKLRLQIPQQSPPPPAKGPV